MKMKVQEYLEQKGLQALVDEFHIKVTDYEDRVVLNYDQIESPRFNPIVDECRALILWKPRNGQQGWRVASRAFDRFYNVGEDPKTEEFPFQGSHVRFEQKIDGSIISLYWDETNDRWQPASRSCAFAEGQSAMGNTFSHIFWQSLYGTKVMDFLNDWKGNKEFTFIFELCSPETRVVTPFTEYKVFLTGCRHNPTGQEAGGTELDGMAVRMGVQRPQGFKFESMQQAIDAANALPSMEEGFVLVYEGIYSFWRLKCKNTKYLAIANMRANGQISAKRILTLIMANDHAEYLSYFPEDGKYFDFIEQIFKTAWEDMGLVWEANKDKPTQKDYALAIIPQCKYDWQKGCLFELRKGKSWDDIRKSLEPKKIAKSMNLKEKLQKQFAIVLDEEEET